MDIIGKRKHKRFKKNFRNKELRNGNFLPALVRSTKKGYYANIDI